MAVRAAAAAPSTLDRLSTSGKIVFGAVFALLFAALFYVGFYGDVSSQLASAKSQENALKVERLKADESKAAYQKDLDEKAKHEANVRELRKALPDDAETPAFLSQMQSLATIAGVT